MVIREASLETVCGITSTLPANSAPEVAFAGKSNVGKSSLINALLNRKALARTSGQPGKTQTINFYKVNQELYLVDLPGYGYAKVSRQTQEKWGKMIERYLHTSQQLRRVFLLVDIRHEPSENDRMMYEWIVHKAGQDQPQPETEARADGAGGAESPAGHRASSIFRPDKGRAGGAVGADRGMPGG